MNNIEYMRAADRLFGEVASQIPPLTAGQLHSLVAGNRLSQFGYRRRCDRYLLALCLALFALAASILWHTYPAGVTPFNVAVGVFAAADIWVGWRAARSLWLMRQSLRLRSRPYRMARYADRLRRLSRRRRLWLAFILRGTDDLSSAKGVRRMELVSLRIPSYSIAACLFLLVAVNSDKAFASSRNYAKVTTTSNKTDDAICETLYNIMAQI